MSPFKVSEEHDAWCIKCKMVLKHVVMSMKGTRPHRVKCKTCQDVHAYRKSEPGSSKKKAATKKTKTKKASTAKAARISEFDRLMEGRDVSTAVAYSMAGRFTADDLIDHKKFGLGIVMRQVDPTKVEVLFAEGSKLMVCGR